MANSQYILTITKKELSYRFKLTYKQGLFLRFERDLAELRKLGIWDNLLFLIPRLECDIPDRSKKEYKSVTVSYQRIIKESKVTVFSACMAMYIEFYTNETKLDPIINNVAGASLKKIIASLKKLTTTDQELIETWQTILSNWKKLEQFYRNQLELKQINSNLNTILRQIKHGKNNIKAKATTAADAARENL